MSRKVNLTALATDPDVASAVTAAPRTIDLAHTPQTPEVPDSVTAEVAAVTRPDHYTQFIRKETRLRADHLDDLAVLARRLNRDRRSPNLPRITENTLIRVAVDALLANSDRLRGQTEAQLRASLTGDRR